jgi:rRNA maturation protein Nop10
MGTRTLTLPWASFAMAELLRLCANVTTIGQGFDQGQKGGTKMPKYTLLATCDRCGEQVPSHPENGSSPLINATGLKYNDYVHPANCNGSGAYLCNECARLAEELRMKHYAERKEFCNQ